MPADQEVIRVEVDKKSFDFEHIPNVGFRVKFGVTAYEDGRPAPPIHATMPYDIVRQLADALPVKEEMEVRSTIQQMVLEHRRRYGCRRVTAELRRRGMHLASRMKLSGINQLWVAACTRSWLTNRRRSSSNNSSPLQLMPAPR